MKNTGTLTLTTPTDREIVLTRVFDAPRALVFEALTTPDLLQQWFTGPPGWSLVVCEPARQAGARYRFVWRGPDGTEMGMGGVCREFVPPERMSATEKFEPSWYSGEAQVSTVLAEQGGKTTLTLTVTYESRETRDAVLKSPMEGGVAYGYDRLADLLASLAAQRSGTSGQGTGKAATK